MGSNYTPHDIPPPSIQPHGLPTPNLPLLLHTLRVLEPAPESFPSHRKRDNRARWGDIPRTETRVLDYLAVILATGISGHENVAVTMKVEFDRVRIFFASSGGFGDDEKEYIGFLKDMVIQIGNQEEEEIGNEKIGGKKRGRKVKGREEKRNYIQMVSEVVLTGCRERVLRLIEGLAGEEWADGVEVEEGEVLCDEAEFDWDDLRNYVMKVGWDSLGRDKSAVVLSEREVGENGREDGRARQKKKRRSKSRSKSKSKSRSRSRSQNGSKEVKCQTESKEGEEESKEERMARKLQGINDGMKEMRQRIRKLRALNLIEENRAAESKSTKLKTTPAVVRQAFIVFLSIIKSADLRSLPWSKLMRCVVLSNLVYQRREALRPLIQFTDDQMVWMELLGVYLEAIKLVAKRASDPRWAKLLVNLEIIEISPPLPPADWMLPQQATIVEVLQWVEEEHFTHEPLLIDAEAITDVFPSADPYSPWPTRRLDYIIHPEVTISHFIYNNIQLLNLPFMAIGTSGICCWACHIYSKTANKTMNKDWETPFYGRKVYKMGCGGWVPDGDLWNIPMVMGDKDEVLRDEVLAVVEDCVRLVVERVRSAVMEIIEEDLLMEDDDDDGEYEEWEGVGEGVEVEVGREPEEVTLGTEEREEI
ncbi:hypothetical protein TWF281_004323 [Arthrobotrys megalospora]